MRVSSWLASCLAVCCHLKQRDHSSLAQSVNPRRHLRHLPSANRLCDLLSVVILRSMSPDPAMRVRGTLCSRTVANADLLRTPAPSGLSVNAASSINLEVVTSRTEMAPLLSIGSSFKTLSKMSCPREGVLLPLLAQNTAYQPCPCRSAGHGLATATLASAVARS